MEEVFVARQIFKQVFIDIFKPSYRSDFRILVAGAGTDGGLSYLAEQLHHTKSETVYLDFSSSSMILAQFKVRIKGVSNVVWVMEWMENIPRLGLSGFDFIGCTGVLHHLKSPQIGLKGLSEAQLPYGGIYLMVYGRYCRTGVYHVQHMCQLIINGIHNMVDELIIARRILESLSKDHWTKIFD